MIIAIIIPIKNNIPNEMPPNKSGLLSILLNILS